MAQRTVRLRPDAAREAILARTCPPNAVVAGDLFLTGEPWLTRLPEGLRVEGRLGISGCHRLAGPIIGLSADSLEISDCAALVGLIEDSAQGLLVPGDLVLQDCPVLDLFPEVAAIRGDLHVSNCGLGWMQMGHGEPWKLAVGGSATIEGCVGLKSLPLQMAVGGDLHILDCPQLGRSSWRPSPDVSVGAACRIQRCHALRRLPSIAFRGEGHLRIAECHSLSAVWEDVRPRGSLHLDDCPLLLHLPDGLALSGSLHATDCPALEWPDGLDVQGEVRALGTTPRRVPPSAGPAEGRGKAPAGPAP